MALKKNMGFAEMKNFLNEELKEQILLEITPILHIGKKQGGYFGVSRQILCLIEFLSALYFGYDEKKDKRFKESNYKERRISNSEKAIKFIKELMGEKVDPFYKLNGKVLFKMYRHGLVHLYQPKTFLRRNKKELKWLAYKGAREKHVEKINGLKFDVRHVAIIPHPSNKNIEYLAVSINCLYYDLVQVIDIYTNLLEQDKKLQANWISAANAISEPLAI